MLTGKELGQAIAKAIALKKASGAIAREGEIARHFGVKQPSLADWKKKGTISKEKLPELWHYFSDVVGPEHWGLTEFSAALKQPPVLTADEQGMLEKWQSASAEAREVARFALSDLDAPLPPWAGEGMRKDMDSMIYRAHRWLREDRQENKKRVAA